MKRDKFLSDVQIEQITSDTRVEYMVATGGDGQHPLSAEKVALQLLNVSPEWESFGLGAQETLGKIKSPAFGSGARLLLNNDCIRNFFEKIPYLENTVIGHELGHLILHVDHGKQFQLPLDLDSTQSIEVSAKTLIDPNLLPSSELLWRERQAHTFMRHLLVPKSQLMIAVAGKRVQSWSDVNALATEFHVTQKVMKIQLEKAGVLMRGMLPEQFPARG